MSHQRTYNALQPRCIRLSLLYRWALDEVQTVDDTDDVLTHVDEDCFEPCEGVDDDVVVFSSEGHKICALIYSKKLGESLGITTCESREAVSEAVVTHSSSTLYASTNALTWAKPPNAVTHSVFCSHHTLEVIVDKGVYWLVDWLTIYSLSDSLHDSSDIQKV